MYSIDDYAKYFKPNNCPEYFEFIKLHKKRLLLSEIEKDSMVKIGGVNNDNDIKQPFEWSECCSKTECWNSQILDPEHDRYKRGYVIVLNKKPLGHIKFKGDRTFLAWRTVEKSSMTPIIFGGLYRPRKNLVSYLEELGKIPDKQWGIVEVDEFFIKPVRFIYESRDDVSKGKSVRERIIKERTLVEKMLDNVNLSKENCFYF